MLLSSVNHSIYLWAELGARTPVSWETWKGLCPCTPSHTYMHAHRVFYSSKSTSWHISALFHGSVHTQRHYTPQRLITTQVCHLVFIWASENLPPRCFSLPPSAFCLFIPSALSVPPFSAALPPCLALLGFTAEAGVLQAVFSVRYKEKWGGRATLLHLNKKKKLKCRLLTGGFYWRGTGHSGVLAGASVM